MMYSVRVGGLEKNLKKSKGVVIWAGKGSGEARRGVRTKEAGGSTERGHWLRRAHVYCHACHGLSALCAEQAAPVRRFLPALPVATTDRQRNSVMLASAMSA